MNDKKFICSVIYILIVFVDISICGEHKRSYDEVDVTTDDISHPVKSKVQKVNNNQLIYWKGRDDTTSKHKEHTKVNKILKTVLLTKEHFETVVNFRYDFIAKFLEKHKYKTMNRNQRHQFKISRLNKFLKAYPEMHAYKHIILASHIMSKLNDLFLLISDDMKQFGNEPCMGFKNLYSNLLGLVPFSKKKQLDIFLHKIEGAYIKKSFTNYNIEMKKYNFYYKHMVVNAKRYIKNIKEHFGYADIAVEFYLNNLIDYTGVLKVIFFESCSDKGNNIHPFLLGLLLFMPEITYYAEWRSLSSVNILNIMSNFDDSHNKSELNQIFHVLRTYLSLCEALIIEDEVSVIVETKNLLTAIYKLRVSIMAYLKTIHYGSMQYHIYSIAMCRVTSNSSILSIGYPDTFMSFILAFTYKSNPEELHNEEDYIKKTDYGYNKGSFRSYLIKNTVRASNVILTFRSLMNSLKAQQTNSSVQNLNNTETTQNDAQNPKEEKDNQVDDKDNLLFKHERYILRDYFFKDILKESKESVPEENSATVVKDTQNNPLGNFMGSLCDENSLSYTRDSFEDDKLFDELDNEPVDAEDSNKMDGKGRFTKALTTDSQNKKSENAKMVATTVFKNHYDSRIKLIHPLNDYTIIILRDLHDESQYCLYLIDNTQIFTFYYIEIIENILGVENDE